MFTPHHCGLFFTHEDVQRIRNERKREPLLLAWDRLLNDEPSDPQDILLVNALRYRLNALLDAGQTAVHLLGRHVSNVRTSQDIIVCVQCHELLTGQPDLDEQSASLLKTLAHVLEANTLNIFADSIWHLAARMAWSIATEQERIFTECVQRFHQIIEHDVHPEGYLPEAVEIAPEAAALRSQISSVQALVLMAEMARCVGLDLWSYEQRGVSILTAASYPLYYFFYPRKWPWNGEQWKPSNGVDEETAHETFQQHVGYIEMVNRRFDKPLRAADMILNELRPVYNRYGGGYVTLTHAPVQKSRGLLSLFWERQDR